MVEYIEILEENNADYTMNLRKRRSAYNNIQKYLNSSKLSFERKGIITHYELPVPAMKEGYQCSICRGQGHNRRRCPQNNNAVVEVNNTDVVIDIP